MVILISNSSSCVAKPERSLGMGALCSALPSNLNSLLVLIRAVGSTNIVTPTFKSAQEWKRI